MFADELRRAIEAAPRITLPQVAALLWRAAGAGQVSEAEAEALSNLIEARRLGSPNRGNQSGSPDGFLPRSGENLSPAQVLRSPDPATSPLSENPTVPSDRAEPAKARAGSRPRTDASMERRRRWVSSGRIPPQLAARFTMGEAAVLAVVAAETARRKDCRLAIEHLAAVAGVSRSTVKNAMREARRLGLITVEERKVTGWRNLPNVVRIVSAEWTAWLRLTRRSPVPGAGHPQGGTATALPLQGGGVKSLPSTPTRSSRPGDSVERHRRKAAGGQGRRPTGATSG